MLVTNLNQEDRIPLKELPFSCVVSKGTAISDGPACDAELCYHVALLHWVTFASVWKQVF